MCEWKDRISVTAAVLLLNPSVHVLSFLKSPHPLIPHSPLHFFSAYNYSERQASERNASFNPRAVSLNCLIKVLPLVCSFI